MFLPQIISEQSNDARHAERLVRTALREALKSEEVAKAVAPFKSNGLAFGHKVIDDYEAVNELLQKCPSHIKGEIDAQKLTAYRLTQMLNMVLRAEFEMVNGKLTGNPSPRKVALLEKKNATVAEQAV